MLKKESYTRRVLPFLKNEYFQNEERILFEHINDFLLKYNVNPTYESLVIEVANTKNLKEDQEKVLSEILGDIKSAPIESNEEWLVDTTEQFCKDRAVHIALMESIDIYSGKNKTYTKDAIPIILSDALAVSFDNHIGHDYIEDYESRFDYYHADVARIPFDLDMLNKITKGGLPAKTLTVLIAGINVGKTLAMCHLASGYLAQGKNVLYITLEVSEEEIGKRIDANLLNISLDDLMTIPKDAYEARIKKLKGNIKQGKLIIHEYPTSSANVLHFKALLSELYLKKKFVPDVVVIDYINICASARLKYGSNVNSYLYVKSIAEEIRGLAVEKKLPIITATQLTRSGFSNSDPDMDDTSESFGLPATADLMLAIINSPELEAMNQFIFKQLKNRLGSKSKFNKFVVGVDRDRQRLFDVADANVPGSETSPPVPVEKPSLEKKKFGGLKI